MERIQDIPRIYTALAEWSACMVFILIAWKKNLKWEKMIFPALMLVWQSFFLIVTGDIRGIGWAVCMFLAVTFLYLFLFFSTGRTMKKTFYYLAFAFILAEFAASLVWQLTTYLRNLGLTRNGFWEWILMIMAYSTIFFFTYHYEKKVLTKEFLVNITRKEAFSMMALGFLIFVFSNLSFLYDTPFSSHVPFDIFIIRTLVDVIGLCVLLVYQSKYHDFLVMKELEQLQLVLDRQYKEYRSFQETIEEFHILKHDLKHQIQALRQETSAEKREQWIREMEEELENSVFRGTTGNPVLDNILEIKLHAVRKWDIHFTYMVNGELLNFMHVRDLCTLFGNAMDNAIESVLQLADSEKRLIQMNVVRQKDMVCILVRNYTENTLNPRKDGHLPQTTKTDQQNHGFGLRSISYCVEKYNGTMSIQLEQNWFQLVILFPIEQ